MDTIYDAKLLIVDDNAELLALLCEQLRGAGYCRMKTAQSCAAARACFAAEQPELMILDINLPDGDGFSLFRALRAKADVPALFLSARDADADRLFGLGLGADDYLTKPFNILELKARIRALLKRSAGRTEMNRTLLTVGDLSLDTQQRVAIRDGKTIDLTAKEYDLLELLMKNPRRVYSRESLMDLVWGYSYAGDYRTVDVHVRRLREKLERVPAEPVYILTKWGVGYYFQGENQPTI